ncbi:hypothetical protein [Chitinophaga sp. sic0106]|uniref:hypothetical protein n=1 Tax=Chitinophaga sp. sic0106 TaxID=2854785 RepID=UPI001C44C708|nr:hypothetical protein [Chitinophaga sp. sic0106]MBV7531630.1 hypothetical protein [Chitinophaga sp. sic0106]
MSQLFSRRPILAALLLLMAACRRDTAIDLQPVNKKGALAVVNTTPDTLWKLQQITFTVNGIPGASMAYNIYDSTGKLTGMSLNKNLGSYYGQWYFQVSYAGNYVYFYSMDHMDTILSVRMDSIGRPSDYLCTYTSNPWVSSLQTGHISYGEPYRTINGISRTLDGVSNNISVWQFADYGPFLKNHNGSSLNYLFDGTVDSTETLHAYYDEVDQPDEWPIRIMRYSGLLPYNPKRKILGLNYLNDTTSAVTSYPITSHVIDYGKKLRGYQCNGSTYSLEWQAFPQ